jgi:diguanylate cyclase (GGDEF)-like protein/PAS domain S-box-containing protein
VEEDVDPSDHDQNQHNNSAQGAAHAYAYRCLNEPGWPNEYASDYALELTGYPPEDLLVGGKVHFGDLIVEGDRRRVWDEVQKALAEDRGFELRYSIRRRDGQVRHVHEYGRGIRDEDGGVVALDGLLYDVTDHRESEEALKKVEERYRTLVEKIPPIIYIQTPRKGEIAAYDTTYISPRVEEVLGYPPQRFTEEPGFWDDLIHPEDLGAVREEDERTDRTCEPFFMEYRVIAEDGRTVWIRDEATLVRDGGGEPMYWLGVQTDVTERKEAEERYRTLVERVPVAIYRQEVEHNGAVTYISPQIEALTGYAPEEYLADPTFWMRTMHPKDRQRVLDEDERTDRTGEPFRVEFRKIARDGRLIWLRDEAVLVRDASGEPLYWQGVVSDITERKTLEERLEHQALHDPLTGLPNRRLFADRLAHALERTRRRGGVAVLFMDLDEFKVVNDSLGHEAGDLLLTVVAQRLGRCLRPEDTLARFGGDEFVVLLEEVGDPGEAVRVARRITEELRRPFVLEGRELYVSASVGISFGTARTKNPEDLLRDADTAMYRAKEGGGGFRVFDQSMYERVVHRLHLENGLRRAVERGEFVLHYQPVFDFDDQRVWGTEALVRWDHPERGLLAPSEFVDVAEETDLIVPIGSWALGEACRRTKEWQDGHPRNPPLGVIVNLSATQLRHPGCEGTVRAALESSGLRPESLSLDVTETAFIDALEDNRTILERIQALGVRISIDDFGMGYSSLSYLKRLPADALKIDKSFLKGFGEDAEDTALVRMIIELGHTLGMEVVAEGVEEWTQAALLAETGCDKAQGYHFSRPLPPEDVPVFLGGG